MFLLLASLRVALKDVSPYEAPVLLCLAALASTALLVRRLRRGGPPGRRTAAAVFGALALVALGVAGWQFARDARLFWSVGWDERRQQVVLERLAPLPSIRLPRADVAAVTEFSAPEHGLVGPVRSVQFAVHTRRGECYWSAPLRRRASVESAREALLNATGGKLERLVIGRRLPLS